jgi:hypothetical protein
MTKEQITQVNLINYFGKKTYKTQGYQDNKIINPREKNHMVKISTILKIIKTV